LITLSSRECIPFPFYYLVDYCLLSIHSHVGHLTLSIKPCSPGTGVHRSAFNSSIPSASRRRSAPGMSWPGWGSAQICWKRSCQRTPQTSSTPMSFTCLTTAGLCSQTCAKRTSSGTCKQEARSWGIFPAYCSFSTWMPSIRNIGKPR